MKKISFLLLFLLSFSQSWSSPVLLSAEKVRTFTMKELDSIFDHAKAPRAFVPINYDVDVYEVMYASHWHDKSVVKASGLYFVPRGKEGEAFPLTAIHHGTQTLRRDSVKFRGHQSLATIMAADGYAVILPDYIGLGKGEKFHLYHHTYTEAMATLDFIRAIREFNPQKGIKLTDQLFLTGYSQGGHVTMAVHKVIEQQFPDEFHVTASAPLSGAYDLDGVQGEVMFKPYSHPGYLPYLLLSYSEAYDLGVEAKEIIKYPYDTIVHWLFQGDHKLEDLNPYLPEIPKDMVKEEVVMAYKNDPEFPFRKALKENSVDDWAPEAPVLMCYCKSDEQVSYENSKVAYRNMQELGAKKVRKKHVARKFGHNQCAPFAYMYAKMYFDNFRKGKTKGKLGPWGKRFLLRMGVIFTKVKKDE